MNILTVVKAALLLLMCGSGSFAGEISQGGGATVDPNLRPVITPGDTGVVNASYVERDFAYEFKIFYDKGTVNSALQDVSAAVMTHLLEVVEERKAPVSIQSLYSTVVNPFCDDIEFDLEGYECSEAQTKVTVKADPELDPELMERVALVDIQKFIRDFNANSTNININFEYPVSVKTSIVIILEGVVGTMGAAEENIFISTFESGFGPLASHNENPSYELDKAEVIVQEAGNLQRLRRVLEEEGTMQGTSYNKAQIFIRATCGTSNCTNENFEIFTFEKMKESSGVLAVMLRNYGEKAGTLYFENLYGITVGESLIAVPPRENDIVLNNAAPQQEDAPTWIWIPVGIVVGIFACTLCWVTVRINQRDEKESALRKQAIPTEKRQSVGDEATPQKLVTIDEIPNDADTPWPANDPDISSSIPSNSNHVKHSVYSEDTRPISNLTCK